MSCVGDDGELCRLFVKSMSGDDLALFRLARDLFRVDLVRLERERHPGQGWLPCSLAKFPHQQSWQILWLLSPCLSRHDMGVNMVAVSWERWHMQHFVFLRCMCIYLQNNFHPCSSPSASYTHSQRIGMLGWYKDEALYGSNHPWREWWAISTYENDHKCSRWVTTCNR